MTVDNRCGPRPTSGAAPFFLNEVFFTRTDGRGVIQSCNHIFRRVAGFDWSEIKGAPHKIVRHPDMPRGVFHMLWDTLKRGEGVGAYVKNRAKDGLYYWVFAVMVPCDGGYLSARCKPSSAMLTGIEGLYARQSKLEAEGSMDPKRSSEWFVEQIRAMGYPDYSRFMSHALSEELLSRNIALKRPEDEVITRFRKMQSAADNLTEETDQLVHEFEMTEIIPHNMRVIASRLEPNGGPISTLSTNYGGMSREMSNWFETHVVGENSNFSKIKGTVAQSLYLQCMARILLECVDQLDFEQRELNQEVNDEDRRILTGLAGDYSALSEAGQNKVAEETYRILDACKKMNRHMLGLSTTRVMCKIEGARLSEGRESLSDIIGELNGFQQRIREKLTKIEDLSGTIRALLV